MTPSRTAKKHLGSTGTTVAVIAAGTVLAGAAGSPLPGPAGLFLLALVALRLAAMVSAAGGGGRTENAGPASPPRRAALRAAHV